MKFLAIGFIYEAVLKYGATIRWPYELRYDLTWEGKRKDGTPNTVYYFNGEQLDYHR